MKRSLVTQLGEMSPDPEGFYSAEEAELLEAYTPQLARLLWDMDKALAKWEREVDDEGNCLCCGCNHKEAYSLSRSSRLEEL